MKTKLQYALELADKGFWVFRLRENSKLPYTKGWQMEATRDAIKITQMFDGEDYNIGIFTSKFDADKALVVIDEDNKGSKRGADALFQLDCSGSNIPLTRVQTTPTGGKHHIYICEKPLKQGANVLGDGLDIRSRGGYIVGAGSSLDGKSYTTTDTQPVEAPDWLTQGLAMPAPKEKQKVDTSRIDPERALARAQKYLENAPIAEEGSRNHTAFKVICELKDRGVTQDVCLELILEWNEENEPPLEQEELESTVVSAYKTGQNPVGCKATEAIFEPVAIHEKEWQEPLPLSASIAPEPYPLDTLPSIIHEAVQETVSFSQFPIALAACSALSVLSLAGQGLADVRRDEKLEGPTSLYFLVIAESGERKTSADNFFMKAVYSFDKRMREENEAPLAKFKASVEIYEAKKQGLKAKLAAATKSGKTDIGAENDLCALENNVPKLPLFPQVVYTDATPEALGGALAEKWPSAGVISAEAGVVFGSHGMGKESVMRNLALLNTLWDGKPFKVDRTVAKSYTLDRARLSMGLAVQVGTVRTFFENCKGLARDTGFAARFLMAYPESTQGTRFYTAPPSGWPCLAAFHARIEAMLSQIPQIEGNGLVLPMLEFSAEAKAQWIKFHDDVERKLAPGGELAETRDVASKAADNVARLAALFHLFEYGSPTGKIDVEHVTRAAAIVNWHLLEARRFLGEIALPRHTDNAAKLDAWLMSWCRQHGENGVSPTDIMQRGPSVVRRKPALDEALQVLEGLRRVKILQSDNSRKVAVNPALLTGSIPPSANAKVAIPAITAEEMETPIARTAEIALASPSQPRHGFRRLPATMVFKPVILEEDPWA